ncbi:MAG: hypothetical protein Q4C63_02245 [Eubacteriales bacterium]|nr:hypothetical protein [Eubacteriales bacterium]
MKKTISFAAAVIAALALSACTPSDITSGENQQRPEGVTETQTQDAMSLKDKPTVEYTIPADAPTGVDGGPGVMETTAVDDSYYPEDKRGVAEESSTSEIACLYVPTADGIVQSLSDVSAMDADGLIAGLVAEGVLGSGTEVTAFSQAGSTASLSLNKLTAAAPDISDEVLLACIVNTFTENLGMDSLSVKDGGQDFGTLSYTDEYNAT